MLFIKPYSNCKKTLKFWCKGGIAMRFRTKLTSSSRNGNTLKSLFLLSLLGLLLFPPHLPADEPFAPWVPLTAEGKAAIGQQEIPGKALVGIPAYPKASIVSLAFLEDKNGNKTIPVIHLVSPDSVETIVNFYKTELLKIQGWQWDEIFEAFYLGESYEEALGQHNPYMEITPVSLDSVRLKYVEPSYKGTLKSWIQIVCPSKT
jgi:hypothetical protein